MCISSAALILDDIDLDDFWRHSDYADKTYVERVAEIEQRRGDRVYFADCPSGGHDMLCLDYRACGPSGEPSVVHVDQELDYQITFVAPSFEAFIRGLQEEDAFEPFEP